MTKVVGKCWLFCIRSYATCLFLSGHYFISRYHLATLGKHSGRLATMVALTSIREELQVHSEACQAGIQAAVLLA